MEKYRQLFGHLDMSCAQVLLTEEDFANTDRQRNLAGTLDRLLELETVPIVNENDAVTSAIKTEDKMGVFYDNDRLAGLTASAVGAKAGYLVQRGRPLHRTAERPEQRAAGG